MEKIQKYLRNGIFLLAGIFTVLSVFKPTTIGLGAGKVMLVIAIAAALIFPIIFLIQQPKQGLKALLGFGIMALIFVLGYVLASGEEVWGVVEGNREMIASANASRLVEAGLNSFIIMFAATVLIFIWGEVRTLFK